MAKSFDRDRALPLAWSQPQWSFSLDFGGSVKFHVRHAPSKFHRFMQRILLGVCWERIDSDEEEEIMEVTT